MPKIFEALANDNAHPCQTLMVTKGGRFLWQNVDKDDEFATAVREAVKSEYDVAILQDQSLVALDSPADFERGVKGHCDLLKAKRILLYATWGRKEGSDKLAERGISSDEMYGKLDLNITESQSSLALRYQTSAKPLSTFIKPILISTYIIRIYLTPLILDPVLLLSFIIKLYLEISRPIFRHYSLTRTLKPC